MQTALAAIPRPSAKLTVALLIALALALVSLTMFAGVHLGGTGAFIYHGIANAGGASRKYIYHG
jgi:hypothetical protein